MFLRVFVLDFILVGFSSPLGMVAFFLFVHFFRSLVCLIHHEGP